MSHLRKLTAFGLLAVLGLLPGCFNSDSSPAGTDGTATDPEEQAAIESVVFEEMGEYADPDVRYYDDGGDTPPLAPINTHAWRRQLLSLDKTIQITITKPNEGPATADVTVTCDATGLLHLWACGDSCLNHYTKDFADTGVRSLYFEKTRQPTVVPHRGWRLVAMSGVLIESDACTRTINSVRVQAGAVDETITNVTDLVRLEDVLRLPAGTEVTVTVDTGDATDHVFLHRRHARMRFELTNNGDGTFTGVYMTGDRPGPRHAAIDVLSDGTLMDDELPYDNTAWGMAYVIE